jgi:hypothetical protein
MKRLLIALSVSAFFVVGHTEASNANPTLLIMAEDGDSEGIPRNTRVSKRIMDELVNQLDTRGFDVYDETAVSLRTQTQGRVRRLDAELIDIAKSIRRPPIDVVIFFEVFANVTRKPYQNELRLRTVGRLLSVGDGRRLGSWEAKLPEDRDQVWLLPNRCFPEGQGVSRDCLLEAVGDDARILAQEVGTIVADKLEANLGSTSSGGQGEGMKRGFNLVFDGFSSRDYRDMEEYLIMFSGYVSHRPGRSSHLNREIWYESTITTSRLERNLHKMLELLELPYVLKFSGNTYTVKAKNLRKKRGSGGQGKKFKW